MRKKRKKTSFIFMNLTKFHIKYNFFAFFLFVFVLIFSYVKFLVVPVVIDNTESQISSYATKSINFAIANSMNQNISYGELINIVRDSNDNVQMIEANAVRINILSKSMSKSVVSNFIELSKMPIRISLGSFFGIAIFAETGPKIAFDVNPYTEVKCYFTSSFDSAGINQTFHKLYLIIELTINIVFPFKQLKIKSDAEVLLAESLIIGKIPEVYLNSSKLDEMLNLVPNRFSS